MAIKWSAVRVSEAMDEVEHQVTLADDFIAEAKVKAGDIPLQTILCLWEGKEVAPRTISNVFP